MRAKYGLLFWTILISIVVHGLVYVGLPTRSSRPSKLTPLLVEIVDSAHAFAPKTRHGRTRSVSKKQPATNSLGIAPTHLSKAGLQAVLHPRFAESGQDPAATGEPDFFDPRSYQFTAKNYDAGNAVRGFTEAIYNRINGRLIFDSILAQYDHFGIVYLEFRVTKSGHLIAESLRASSHDKILQVHVIRSALLPALSTDLNENLWAPGEIKIKARFVFSHGSSQATLFDENPERIAGFALSFRRSTSQARVARSLGQHLLSGGLSYDPFSMYEAWKNYEKAGERRRLDTDPFALYRADPYSAL